MREAAVRLGEFAACVLFSAVLAFLGLVLGWLSRSLGF